jgi:hypothetical protein
MCEYLSTGDGRPAPKKQELLIRLRKLPAALEVKATIFGLDLCGSRLFSFALR